MKKIINRLPTYQELRDIPDSILPKKLKKVTIFNNIKKISIEYGKNPKSYFQLFKFMRQESPAIKYHNPNLILERKLIKEGPAIPIVRVFGFGDQLLQQFESSKYKTMEELVTRFKSLDAGIIQEQQPIKQDQQLK